jgi:uncharacterized repeat protein (TIGR03803 family)
LYSFNAPPDGRNPEAGLFNLNTGTLYGTTGGGGAHSCKTYYGGCGTVFSITTGGAEKVLHSFGTGTDGRIPEAPLIGVGGTLYGTTSRGGSVCSQCGTVFSITTGGTEKVLHSFGAVPDGVSPAAGVIDDDGKLYGTTESGGAYGYGTVFSITTGGAEKILHSFREGRADGFDPQARLLDVGGTLYGTTTEGGAYGGGVVFSIATGGAEKVLHSFGKGTDGSVPEAGLVKISETLYGTTEKGGAYGDGAVFSITTSGAEKVLHSFNGTDGYRPFAGLTEIGGTFYGTTSGGGAYAYGTLFSVTPGGIEKVLHSFGPATDGATPVAGIHAVGGTLYGTTVEGGAHYYGTVFSLTP